MTEPQFIGQKLKITKPDTGGIDPYGEMEVCDADYFVAAMTLLGQLIWVSVEREAFYGM